MKGQVLAWEKGAETGTLEHEDGRALPFEIGEWRADPKPAVGMPIDFGMYEGKVRSIYPLVPASKLNHSWRWLWFSLSGRAPRRDYWLRYFLPSLILSFIASLIDINLSTPTQPAAVAQPIVSILLIWPGIAVWVKRLHDLGMSGRQVVYYFVFTAVNAAGLWWLVEEGAVSNAGAAWFVMLPSLLFALWVFLQIGFQRGQPGRNVYGPDPLDRKRVDPD